MNTNYHVKFAESVTGYKVAEPTEKRLDHKLVKYTEEVNDSYNSCEHWFSRQITHIFQSPFKVVSLALQTLADTVAFVVTAILDLGTLHTNSFLKSELSGRAYNLFVADTFTWLSLVPSFFCYHLYDGANSLHLGTMLDQLMHSSQTLKSLSPPLQQQ